MRMGNRGSDARRSRRVRGALLLLLLGVLAASASPAAAAGGTVTKRSAKERRVLLEPARYGEVVLLVNNAKEYKYYRFSTTAPLALEVTGPTKLELLVRLLFDKTMKGTQDFTLRVEEDRGDARRELGAYALKARKSGVSVLKSLGEVVPSQGERLDIEVPEGRHAYRVALGGADGRAAIARVLIPKKDLAAGAAAKGALP